LAGGFQVVVTSTKPGRSAVNDAMVLLPGEIQGSAQALSVTVTFDATVAAFEKFDEWESSDSSLEFAADNEAF